MSTLLTADLHLTDNPRDSDRWNLFPWIEKQVDKYKIKQVYILGDLTDSKDRHSAKLVNRVVDVISSLAQKAHVVILKGNHDAIDFDTPFFGFARRLDNVTYISNPTSKDGVLYLPCTRDYKKDWEHFTIYFNNVTKIFTHNTFDGCLSENGTKLDGIPPSVFKGFKGKVWSGDIHAQQKVGSNIEYVGSPYPVRFGDNFVPRLVLIDSTGTWDLHYPFKRKELIELNSATEGLPTFPEGTQVKIRVRLKRSEFHEWKKIRKALDDHAFYRGWELCGLELVTIQQRTAQIDLEEMTGQEPKKVLVDFAKRKKLSKAMTNAGLEYLKRGKQ